VRRPKTTNNGPDRLFPLRYTDSKSLRRTRRQERGNRAGRPRSRAGEEPGGSDNGEAAPAFPAALCQDLASTFRFHPRAEAVRLVTVADVWLVRAFRQRGGSLSRSQILQVSFLVYEKARETVKEGRRGPVRERKPGGGALTLLRRVP
jgi:hypothetical protein